MLEKHSQIRLCMNYLKHYERLMSHKILLTNYIFFLNKNVITIFLLWVLNYFLVLSLKVVLEINSFIQPTIISVGTSQPILLGEALLGSQNWARRGREDKVTDFGF